MISWKSICVFLVLIFLSYGGPVTNKQTERKINILNQSGSKVSISWVHPDTRETVLMTTPDIMNGATFPLNSFINHEFEFREVPATSGGKCKSKDKVCRVTYTVVSPGEEQVFTLNEDFKIVFVDDKIKVKEQASDLVKTCQNKAEEKLNAAAGNSAKVQSAMDQLLKCVEVGLTNTLAAANEELNFQAQIRKGMAEQMENYTCADLTLNSTDSLRNKVWRSDKDKTKRNVQIMLDRPASRVHVIENFISPEECEAMEEAAKPKLHRATVADGKGGSHLSEHRKAMQAGIKVDWRTEKENGHIAVLSRRVYDYTNDALGLNIKENGQEDLMSIQYFGRGEDEVAPDRYTPHCDGECDGMKHKFGSRMATVVMYCKIPEVGGHTNFRNSYVHVKPRKGDAIFFSYMNPETMIMDNGFTEHSGCPVIEGEKKIVTQWIRYGVDDQNPWYSFNTLGVKINGDEELEDEEE